MVLIGRTNKHNFLFPSRVAMSLSFVVSVTIITCSRAQIQVIGIWSRLHGIWSVISNGSRSSVDDSCPLHTPLIIIWIQLETMTRPLPTSIKLQLNLCVVIRWINIIHISSLPAKVSSPVLSMPLIH